MLTRYLNIKKTASVEGDYTSPIKKEEEKDLEEKRTEYNTDWDDEQPGDLVSFI